MARPRKATEDLVREGTYRADRHSGRKPARLAAKPQGPDALTERLDALLGEDRPAWLKAADALALGLLRSRLTLRADLIAQVEAGDVTARRDLLALDRILDAQLAALGLVVGGRQRLALVEPSTGGPLEELQRRRAERLARMQAENESTALGNPARDK